MPHATVGKAIEINDLFNERKVCKIVGREPLEREPVKEWAASKHDAEEDRKQKTRYRIGNDDRAAGPDIKGWSVFEIWLYILVYLIQ